MGSFPQAPESDPDFPPHQFAMIYPGHAQEAWFGKESWQRISDPGSMFAPWDEEEPFKTLHAQLKEACQNALLIVIIGYAFQDARVNGALLDAIATNRSTREFVTDPGRPGIASQIPPYDWMTWGDTDTDWSRFSWLQGRFGEPETTAAVLDAMMSVGSHPERQ